MPAEASTGQYATPSFSLSLIVTCSLRAARARRIIFARSPATGPRCPLPPCLSLLATEPSISTRRHRHVRECYAGGRRSKLGRGRSSTAGGRVPGCISGCGEPDHGRGPCGSRSRVRLTERQRFFLLLLETKIRLIRETKIFSSLTRDKDSCLNDERNSLMGP